LCFAHHTFVLDELEKEVGLSNAKGSDKRFIRIDGSTNPRHRQAQIKAFQTDPSIRIAVLSITAAGVAVTLTSSSTVWFAELYWTPALMIQAEGEHEPGRADRIQGPTSTHFLFVLDEKIVAIELDKILLLSVCTLLQRIHLMF
jgi:SWI/SNF-related matrix-associated actin-dependent regulator 1 of chromatin subfamily A